MSSLLPIGVIADKDKKIVHDDEIFYPVTYIIMLDIVSMEEIAYSTCDFSGDKDWIHDSMASCMLRRNECLFVKDDLEGYKILGSSTSITGFLSEEQVQVSILENEKIIQTVNYGSGIIYLRFGEKDDYYIKVDIINRACSIGYDDTLDFAQKAYLLHKQYINLWQIKPMFEKVQDDVFKCGDTYYFDSIRCNLMFPDDCRVAILYDCGCESIVINSNIKRIIFYNDYRYNSLSVPPKYLYIPSTLSEEILVKLLITLIFGYLRKNHKVGGLDIAKIQDLYEKRQYTELLRELRTEVYASLISKSLENTEVAVY